MLQEQATLVVAVAVGLLAGLLMAGTVVAVTGRGALRLAASGG